MCVRSGNLGTSVFRFVKSSGAAAVSPCRTLRPQTFQTKFLIRDLYTSRTVVLAHSTLTRRRSRNVRCSTPRDPPVSSIAAAKAHTGVVGARTCVRCTYTPKKLTPRRRWTTVYVYTHICIRYMYTYKRTAVWGSFPRGEVVG